MLAGLLAMLANTVLNCLCNAVVIILPWLSYLLLRRWFSSCLYAASAIESWLASSVFSNSKTSLFMWVHFVREGCVIMVWLSTILVFWGTDGEINTSKDVWKICSSNSLFFLFCFLSFLFHSALYLFQYGSVDDHFCIVSHYFFGMISGRVSRTPPHPLFFFFIEIHCMFLCRKITWKELQKVGLKGWEKPQENVLRTSWTLYGALTSFGMKFSRKWDSLLIWDHLGNAFF